MILKGLRDEYRWYLFNYKNVYCYWFLCLIVKMVIFIFYIFIVIVFKMWEIFIVLLLYISRVLLNLDLFISSIEV